MAGNKTVNFLLYCIYRDLEKFKVYYEEHDVDPDDYQVQLKRIDELILDYEADGYLNLVR
jgi:hypothetical protein